MYVLLDGLLSIRARLQGCASAVPCSAQGSSCDTHDRCLVFASVIIDIRSQCRRSFCSLLNDARISISFRVIAGGVVIALLLYGSCMVIVLRRPVARCTAECTRRSRV
ncbi:hypothetical protein BCR37DRAFT_383333, partial [Protomyces lactucae-debilis]